MQNLVQLACTFANGATKHHATWWEGLHGALQTQSWPVRIYHNLLFSKTGIPSSKYDLKIDEMNSFVTLHMGSPHYHDAKAIARIWGKNPHVWVRAVWSWGFQVMHGEAGIHCGVEYGNLEIWVCWITLKKKCSSCSACSCMVASEAMSDPWHWMHSWRYDLHDML